VLTPYQKAGYNLAHHARATADEAAFNTSPECDIHNMLLFMALRTG